MAVLADHSVVFSAGIQGVAQVEMVVVAHSNTDGSERWRRSLTSDLPSYHPRASLALDASGALLAATSQRERYGRWTGLITKLQAASGSTLWRVDLPDVGIETIVVDGTGDIIAAGMLTGPDSYEALVVTKHSGVDGHLLWRFVLDGGVRERDSGTEIARDLVLDEQGDVYVAGSLVDDVDQLDYGPNGFSDFLVIKIAGSTGSEVWRRQVESNGSAWTINLTPDRRVIAAGGVNTDTGWIDALTLALDSSNGEELWRDLDPGVPNAHGEIDLWLASAMSPSGSILLSGQYDSGFFATKKLSASSGQTEWSHQVGAVGGALGGGCCVGTAVSASTQGDAFVVGYTWIDMAQRILVSRLDGATGTSVWDHLADRPSCGESPYMLSLGRVGGLAVAGASRERVDGTCTGGQYLVFTLDSETGGSWTGPAAVCGNRSIEPGESCDDGNQTNGDGCSSACSLELPDGDADGAPDASDNCPARSNPDQADRDRDGIGDLCDSFPDEADHEKAQCFVDRDDAQSELESCRSDPPLPDADGDGEADPTDRCPGTPSGAAIDGDGCSIDQFCAGFDVRPMRGRASCNNADWRNNQPLGSHDCAAVEDKCVARQPLCGLGFELVFLLPPLMWIHRRREMKAA